MSDKKKWYNLFITTEEKPVEASEGPEEPPKMPQRVSDVAAEVPTPKFQAPLKKESQEGVDFQTIYEAAVIVPPKHGFTILKVSDMLQSEHLKSMTLEIKRNAILVALEAGGAKIEDVIQDAVKRDRALDAYEKVEERALGELEQQKAAENAALQKEIDEFLQRKHAQIKANNDVVEQAKRRFSAWQLKKQKEEQRIYDTVGCFVSENPITTSTRPAPATPDQNPHEPATDVKSDKKKLP